MSKTDQLINFRKMLLDCYGVWSTHLDGDLHFLETNGMDINLHQQILLSEERRKKILDHISTSHMPLILGSELGMVWAIVSSSGLEAVDAPQDIWVLGPVYTGNISKSSLERMTRPLRLLISQKWGLIDCLERVPTVSHIVLSQHTLMLQYILTGDVIKVSDLIYNKGDALLQERLSAESEETAKGHAPLITEKTLLDMVRRGDLNYHDALSFAGTVSPGIRIRSGDPLVQAKYSVIAFIVLCSRAAIEGGLSSDVAYSLCDYYTEGLDGCKTISEVASISHTMYEDFIRRVNRCRNATGLSHAVQACCDYIATHPMETLSAEELAQKAGYTTYYFSRIFKQQTGKTIKEYTREARFERAKLLLSATTMSIQEIAEVLHFCSQSYFAVQFQKYVGVSPAEYRTQNRSR